MYACFPQVRIGAPLRYQGVSVFPLFNGFSKPVEYTLAQDAIGSGAVSVEEVSEAGSVPDLLVDNKGDLRVLFLEGEQLVGAKQDRILNTSVLIAAHSRTKVPVSCVERGRWQYRSRAFGASGSHAPPKLRYLLKMSVGASALAARGHRADQGKVWKEVARQQSALGTPSATGAMADTFGAQAEKIADFRTELPYVEGACGLAVAVGKKIVAIDVFDKATTCRHLWERLLNGCVLDALEGDAEPGQAEVADVEELLRTAAAMAWAPAAAVGEGKEYRASEGDQVHASALTLDEVPVHVSVVVGKEALRSKPRPPG
ncbi:MAG: hypothetical protein JXQ29_18205 [Planctomycetes bacterium]|nr:hypothetical protein [Planctomycetota bacterium]